MTTGAVILAAGKASRFGAVKQLLEIDGETLVDRACRLAAEAGCSPVLRVLGAHAGEIQKRGCPPGVHTLVHDQWEQGMGGSLAAGVRELLEISQVDSLLVLLADQAGITAELLQEIRQRLPERGIVLCDHGASTGPPAAFTAGHFPALMALTGDRGAKAVAAAHETVCVGFPAAAWDIDTPEVWSRLCESLRDDGSGSPGFTGPA